MQGGKLRHRITIQAPTPGAADGYGGSTRYTWATFASVSARIEPQTGRQLEYARSFAATVTHKITTRYVHGVLPTMRVMFGTRIFEINGAIDIEERKRELSLFCTERKAT